MGRVLRRPAARRDLTGIWHYIATDSPTRASAFLRRIEERIALLSDNPGLGSARFPAFPDVRYFPYQSYLLIYRPLSDGEGIELIRVIHAAQDIEALLGKRR